MGQSSLAVVAVVCRWWVVSMPLRLRRRLWGRGDVSRWFGEGGGACRRRRGWRWLAEVVVEVAPGWRPVDQALDRPARSTARLTGFWPGWRPVGARSGARLTGPGARLSGHWPGWRPVDRISRGTVFLSPVLERNQAKSTKTKGNDGIGG